MNQEQAKILADIQPVLHAHRDWFWMEFWYRSPYEDRVAMPKNVVIKGWPKCTSLCLAGAIVVEHVGIVCADDFYISPANGETFPMAAAKTIGIEYDVRSMADLFNAYNWGNLDKRLYRADETVDNACKAIVGLLARYKYNADGTPKT